MRRGHGHTQNASSLTEIMVGGMSDPLERGSRRQSPDVMCRRPSGKRLTRLPPVFRIVGFRIVGFRAAVVPVAVFPVIILP